MGTPPPLQLSQSTRSIMRRTIGGTVVKAQGSIPGSKSVQRPQLTPLSVSQLRALCCVQDELLADQSRRNRRAQLVLDQKPIQVGKKRVFTAILVPFYCELRREHGVYGTSGKAYTNSVPDRQPLHPDGQHILFKLLKFNNVVHCGLLCFGFSFFRGCECTLHA